MNLWILERVWVKIMDLFSVRVSDRDRVRASVRFIVRVHHFLVQKIREVRAT